MVRSKGKELFYIPGGKREAGETDEEALKREIREELQVELTEGSIFYFGQVQCQADGKAQGVQVKISCYTANYSGELKPDSEIEELRFLDSSQEQFCSEASLLVLKELKNQGLVD